MTRAAMPTLPSRSRFEFFPHTDENIRRIDEFSMRWVLSSGATQISAENQSSARRGKRFAVFPKNVSSALQNGFHALKLFCRFPKMIRWPQIRPAAHPIWLYSLQDL